LRRGVGVAARRPRSPIIQGPGEDPKNFATFLVTSVMTIRTLQNDGGLVVPTLSITLI